MWRGPGKGATPYQHVNQGIGRVRASCTEAMHQDKHRLFRNQRLSNKPNSDNFTIREVLKYSK